MSENGYTVGDYLLDRLAELGVTEPEHINQAMLTELDALRAARAAEAEELSEIIAALNPLIEEAAANA